MRIGLLIGLLTACDTAPDRRPLPSDAPKGADPATRSGRARVRGPQPQHLVEALGKLRVRAPQADGPSDMGRDLAVRAYFDPDHQRGFLRIGDYTSKMYHAWKAQLADLDADGVSEVVLGVWSRQRRHDEPEPHRSVWVLRWDPERASLIEIWRGSALARPLVDFSIRDQGLIAHEHIADRCYETTYAWTGFGFAVEEARPIACGGP